MHRKSSVSSEDKVPQTQPVSHIDPNAHMMANADLINNDNNVMLPNDNNINNNQSINNNNNNINLINNNNNDGYHTQYEMFGNINSIPPIVHAENGSPATVWNNFDMQSNIVENTTNDDMYRNVQSSQVRHSMNTNLLSVTSFLFIFIFVCICV